VERVNAGRLLKMLF